MRRDYADPGNVSTCDYEDMPWCRISERHFNSLVEYDDPLGGWLASSGLPDPDRDRSVFAPVYEQIAGDLGRIYAA